MEFDYWSKELDKVMERIAVLEMREHQDKEYREMLEVQFQYCRKMVIKYKED